MKENIKGTENPMNTLNVILGDVYNNNPSLKSFLRVLQFFTKSANKLGLAWRDGQTWILPLEKRKLRLKPDAEDLAEYMRISKVETYVEEFDQAIIFSDKPLTCLQDCRQMINMFIKLLINMSLAESLMAQQEQMIYRITRYVKAPLIELFDKLDETAQPIYQMPQSSILIGLGQDQNRTRTDSAIKNEQKLKVEQKIKRNVEATLDIADNLADIIDMAKIDLGKAKLVEVEIQMEELIHEVISIIKDKHTKASIIPNIDTTVPSCLIGDEKRIKQILLSIWTNCIANLEADTRPNINKKRGGLCVEVSAILIDPKAEGIVSGSVDSQYYLISFEINDFRSKEMLKSSFSQNLNLNLSAKLIDLMGGNLIFREYSGGTSIIIELILCVDKLYDVRYNTLRIAQHKQVLLIADDCDPEKIVAIKEVLQDHKIKYTYASTTLEANILYSDIIFDLYIAKFWNSNVAKHLPIDQYRDKVQVLDMLKY